MTPQPNECAGGCGAELDPDMGPYCPECQSKGLDPEVPTYAEAHRRFGSNVKPPRQP